MATDQPCPIESVADLETLTERPLPRPYFNPPNKFYDICMEGDHEAVIAMCEENRADLCLWHGDYVVLKELIRRREFELCKILHEKLEPITVSILQVLATSRAHRDLLESVLDLTAILGLELCGTREEYLRILSKACSSDQDLSTIKRVYGLWSIPDPYRVLYCLSSSWDHEKVDYFLEQYVQSIDAYDFTQSVRSEKAVLVTRAAESGNIYAFKCLLSSFDIDWVSMAAMRIKQTQLIALFYIIKLCADETSGSMIGDLVECISSSQPILVIENIQCERLSGFWDQYANALVSVCKYNHTTAFSFFIGWLQPQSKHIRLFIEAAGSEAIGTIIEAVSPILTGVLAIDLAKCTQPPVRAHLLAYYKSLVSLLEDDNTHAPD